MRIRTLVLALVTLATLLAPAGVAGAQAPPTIPTSAAVAPIDAGAQPTPFNGSEAADAGSKAGAEGTGGGHGGANPPGFATYRVYATQYAPNTQGAVEAAVPDRCAKFAGLRNQTVLNQFGCPAGYRLDLDYRVVITRDNGQTATIPVREVGPWNLDDNYWAGPGSPRPRRLYNDLPRGVPEAQAAFYNGYNTVPNCTNLSTGQPSGRAGGADQFGRCVLNPAGIDLSIEAAKQLGLGNLENAWVTVSFLWEPLDTTLTVQHSGKNLDINFVSTSPGAQAIQWPANGGRNQAWRFISTGTANVYFIQVQHSGMMLDVEGVSTAAGARVIQWPSNGQINQMWRLVPAAPGTFNLIAQHSGMALDVGGVSRDDGALIIQWPTNGGTNQMWRPAVSGL